MCARTLATLAILFSSLTLLAQQSDMRAWLNDVNHAEALEHLKSLGVDEKALKDRKQPPEDSMIRWKPILDSSKRTYAILFLPCKIDSAYLYLLRQDQGAWKVVDRLELDCHYDNSVTFDVFPIRSPTIDEVLVHHVGAGHGAGISVQDFEVLDILNDKLKTVLETEEVEVLSRAGGGPRYELLERSTFTAIPVSRSRSYLIEQTRSQTLNGNVTVQRRLFHWGASSGHYFPSKFTKIEARVK